MRIYKFILAICMVLVPFMYLVLGYFGRYGIETMIASMIISFTMWQGLIHMIDSFNKELKDAKGDVPAQK